jgi:tight adherence protein C
MSIQVLLGASMVSAAIASLVWALRANDGTSTALVSGNLTRGFTRAETPRPTLDDGAADRLFRPMVGALARRSRRLTPAGMAERLESLLVGSGSSWTIEQVLAAKLLLGGVTALITVLRFVGSPSIGGLLVAVFVSVGCWYAPDFVLSKRVDERREQLRRQLPDAMDQLTITVEAGLGFDAALARVAASGDGPLHEELGRTIQDVQVGVSRGEALDRLALRTDVPELRQFVTAVRQAERYGLPIANVLRLQSSEVREKRRQAAEERAMKIPVKVLFPLMFCILPVLFIVVIGPGVIRMMDAFGS